MTVKELIKLLETVADKEVPITIGTEEFGSFRIEGVRSFTDKVTILVQ